MKNYFNNLSRSKPSRSAGANAPNRLYPSHDNKLDKIRQECYNFIEMIRIFYWLLVFGLAVISWISWFSILLGFDPYQSGIAIKILFFLNLAFAILSTILTIVLWKKRRYR